MIKKTGLRIIRRSAHSGSKVLKKSLHFARKVEGKATRILDGTDFSTNTIKYISFEKMYYSHLPFITPLNPSMPAIGSEGKVVLFLPTLDGKSFYGGTATALVVAGRIAQLQKKSLKIVQTLKTGKPIELSAFFKQEGLDIPDENIHVVSVAERKHDFYGYVSIHPDDVHIASAWWDAHLLGQLPLTKKFIYLVQDFEPIFYNNSDQYVLAEATYSLQNCVPLCNTELMHEFMTNKGYSAFKSTRGMWFEPAVSRADSGYIVKKKENEKRRLFLYGRPDVHRNLFFTALQSIDQAVRSNYIEASKWEFFMAGQDNIPDITLSSGVTVRNMGKMSMEEYTLFSKTIDIAISPMMAPHPNYPTLEFASIGSQVVTTRYANKVDLSNYSKNITTVDISVASLASAIKTVAEVDPAQATKNLKSSSINDNWIEALDKPLSLVLKRL